MAAKGEDSLTQIQKYKAMLRSKRSKSDEKNMRKPNDMKRSEEDGEPGLEENASAVSGSTEGTSSETQSEDFKQDNVEAMKLETNTDISTESKQSPMLSSAKDDDTVEPDSITRTGAEKTTEGKESEQVNSGPPGEIKDGKKKKKEKSKGLSIQRKKKSKKRKEKAAQAVENEGQMEDQHEEKYSRKESGTEFPYTSPLSTETKQDDDLFVDANPGPNLEANDKENRDEQDGEKEKISRAKKFKRWATFGKGKKSKAVVVENESVDRLQRSEPNNSPIQDPESSDDGTPNLGKQNSPEKSEGLENSANEEEDLEPPPLPQKQRRRTLSLNEPVDKENESFSLENAQRTRSASAGEEQISLVPEKPKRSVEEENLPIEQDSEKSSSQNEEETAELDKQNNEGDNEVENERPLAEQKTECSIVEDAHDEQQSPDNKEPGDNTAIPTKDDQPKKKKKGFLRKIASKNPKANKKYDGTKEQKTSKRPDISAPLLVKYESLTGSDVLSTSKPIETSVSPEKSNKRKKTGLNIKLPKALKRAKAGDYQVIKGAEAEKEIQRDEVCSQDNLETTDAVDDEEKTQDLQPLEQVPGEDAGIDEPDDKNAGDREAHRVCRALMKDVLEELLTLEKNKEQEENRSEDNEGVRETNDMPILVVDLKNNEDEKADNVQKEDEYCTEPIAGETSGVTSQEMIEQDKNQVTSENGDEQEKDKEEDNVDGDVTLKEEEENLEPKEQSSDETVQESPELEAEEPKEPEKPEGEPNADENEPKSKDINAVCEDEIKQPEEIPKETEGEPNKLEDNPQPEDVPTKPEGEPSAIENEPEPEVVTTTCDCCEDENKQPEEMPKETEGQPNKLEDNSQSEDLPTEPEDEPKKSEDNQVSELSELQPIEASCERSAEDKLMVCDGPSNLYSKESSTVERSIEVTMKTQALIDTYILIDHSIQLSQDFLKQIEMMDLNTRRSRCSIM